MGSKIMNDPVHGFITIDGDFLLNIIGHPWFQRLRRIRQLGLTSLVYPGAQHTRFQHAIGAMHLLQMALETLSNKGTLITEKEGQDALAAILLHDIGHGPFSHALERMIVSCHHEDVSHLIMERINDETGGQLSGAINIFLGQCIPFMHQLISSQLDTDRLDYLKRDSFFSGVAEGTIGSDRIIKMLDVTADKQLGIEAKGIYTIEDFLIARRLMYWQVYLHKTVVSAEKMLRMALKRARDLAHEGKTPETAPFLKFFIENDITEKELRDDQNALDNFCLLDDDDVTTSLKLWTRSDDKVLAFLAKSLVNRKLFHIEMNRAPFPPERIEAEKERIARQMGLTTQQAEYLVVTGQVSSNTYSIGVDHINIINKDGSCADIADVSDMINLEALRCADKRHYLCYLA